jgi:predicted enzyme related to lactoylglutathione lyase
VSVDGHNRPARAGATEDGMKFTMAALAACVLTAATMAAAQESGVRVRSIRVLATDPEAIATFYQKAFGMSETSRPVNTATFKEIIINSGSTVEMAKKATSTPIVIATRPKDAQAGAMAALILQVPDIDKAVEKAKAAGATVLRPPNKTADGLGFVFLKDPDGNQIELVMPAK